MKKPTRFPSDYCARPQSVPLPPSRRLSLLVFGLPAAALTACALLAGCGGGGNSSGSSGSSPLPAASASATASPAANSTASPSPTMSATPSASADEGTVVSIAPAATTLSVNASTTFIARQSSGSGGNLVTVAALWSVQEGDGGTITAEGVYTAPAQPGTYHVVATVSSPSAQPGVATVIVQAGGAEGTIQ